MNKNVAVFFGGESVEHDVSIITAMQVIAILEQKFNVIPIYITSKNELFTGQLNEVQTFLKPDFLNSKNIFKVSLHGNMLYKFKSNVLKPYQKIDVAFNACHGGMGENGAIQGLFEVNGICYTGANVFNSALFMDKFSSKQLLKANGLSVIPAQSVTKTEWQSSKEDIFKKFSFENQLIVKPCNLGSSIGISKCSSFEELERAFETAFSYDDYVLVEEFLNDCDELCCACLNNGTDCITSNVEKVEKGADLFTFEQKYVNNENLKCLGLGGAKVSDSLVGKIEKLTVKIAKRFDITGVFRVDYLVCDNKIYVCEVNTIPGSMAINLFNGKLSAIELLEKIIESAETTFNEKKNIIKSFESSVLSVNENNNFHSKGCGKH